MSDPKPIGSLLPALRAPAKESEQTITEIDYRQGNIPAHVRKLIEAHFEIEAEEAREAGALGFMARALVVATMPYKDPKTEIFRRVNGNFTLRIVGSEQGVPYGIYPRLLMNWLTTEAVSKKSPVIELGDSLRDFMLNVLEVRQVSGGANGSGTRVVNQMKRLFGSMVTAKYHDKTGKTGRGFSLNNVLVADRLDLADESGDYLWQAGPNPGTWRSEVRLNDSFYREIVDRPVPVDMRAFKGLRGSPLAMDVYCWLTYKMSYLQRPTYEIPWEVLVAQFGSRFGAAKLADAETRPSAQAIRDFKKAFLQALKMVLTIYEDCNVKVGERGLILKPSPTHVPMIASKARPKVQPDLFNG